MSYETILFDTSDDGIATITLNRPDRLNAFNHLMGAEIRDVWHRVRRDDKVRVVILRAAGDRAFSSGVDVKEGGWADKSLGPFDWEDPGPSLGPKQNQVWKPMICAVHGIAAGGAFYWLNEADIIICSEDAQFFDPHVTFGLVSAVEPTGMLGRIPLGEIMRMVLLGNDERMSAQTALRISLVSEITSRDKLWDRAHQLAAIIASKPSAAIQGSVKAVWEARDLPPSVAVKMALTYCQLGNPLGEAEVDRWSVPAAKWTER
jgi:enoyl-CoA hydratase/carnithine racemase